MSKAPLIHSVEEFNERYLHCSETPEEKMSRQMRELTPEELGKVWAEELLEKIKHALQG